MCLECNYLQPIYLVCSMFRSGLHPIFLFVSNIAIVIYLSISNKCYFFPLLNMFLHFFESQASETSSV